MTGSAAERDPAHLDCASVSDDDWQGGALAETLRQEFLTGMFASIADAQAQLDVWVRHYNFERRHQGIGDVVPWERSA